MEPKRDGSGKFQVTADPRRGTISLERGNDGELQFHWTDRMSSRKEDQFHRMLFPEEAQFKRVKTGREHDRVYMLKYVQGQQRFMFWIQERASDKDEENCSKINEYANNPAAARAAAEAVKAAAEAERSAAAAAAGGGAGSDLMRALGMPGLDPSRAPAPAPAPSAYQNVDLSSLLNQFAVPATRPVATPAVLTPPAPAAAPPALLPTERTLSLQDIITAEGVVRSGALDDAELVDLLLAHMPDGQRSREHLVETLHSPQFQQALQAFGEALQSDNFNSIMANLSIDPSPAMPHLIRGDGVAAFLAAFQAQFPATLPPSPSSTQAPEEKKDGDGESGGGGGGSQ